MRIALVNYRFFIAGGPERYMFNIMALLKEKGHEVIPFSVKNKRNIFSEYEKYFLSPIGDGGEVYFSEVKKNIKSCVKGFGRMVYSFEAKKCFKKFLKEAKPDVVYILYFQNKISCSIVDAAYEMGIPVVQRISDYSLLVPCDHLYDLNQRCICEKCLFEGLKNAVKHKCVYQSRVYSLVKSLALIVQKYRRTNQKISRYIFPSSFTLKKFVECGFDRKKLIHIPTPFYQGISKAEISIEYQPFALYVGRIDPDKGIETLLKAFVGTDFNLKIIGFSSTEGYEEQVKKIVSNKISKIEFLGRKDFEGIQEYLSKCLFTVIPSEWYDNLPNSLLESYFMGKCVVASNIGSLSENVVDKKTGLLFESRNPQSLREKVSYLFEAQKDARRMGENAKKNVNTLYSANGHVERLCKIFNELTENRCLIGEN